MGVIFVLQIKPKQNRSIKVFKHKVSFNDITIPQNAIFVLIFLEYEYKIYRH